MEIKVTPRGCSFCNKLRLSEAYEADNETIPLRHVHLLQSVRRLVKLHLPQMEPSQSLPSDLIASPAFWPGPQNVP